MTQQALGSRVALWCLLSRKEKAQSWALADPSWLKKAESTGLHRPPLLLHECEAVRPMTWGPDCSDTGSEVQRLEAK